jgi:hypothetical protein
MQAFENFRRCVSYDLHNGPVDLVVNEATRNECRSSNVEQYTTVHVTDKMERR